MKNERNYLRFLTPLALLLLIPLAVACGGGGNKGKSGGPASADTTRPAVTLAVPADASTGIATNTQVAATFSEDMAPATISGATFTLTCASCTVMNPAGSVSYAVGARTATFSVPAGLEANKAYTATITTGATDLAGNALAGDPALLPAASDFVWSFTTGATADVTSPIVRSMNPAPLATGQCRQKTVNASFSEDMDPATLTIATFTLQKSGPPLGNAIDGSVAYDASSKVVTFAANNNLTPNTSYTATITTGAEDLAGNALASNQVWTFTTGTQDCQEAVDLGAAAPLGTMGGGSGMTNQGTLTVISGDIASSATAPTAVTGFHDLAGDIYTETGSNKGTVNGKIYTCTTSTTGPTSAAVNPASCSIAQQAASDAVTAYNDLAALPSGPDPGAGSLGNLVLAPGVYTSAAGSFLVQGGDLTLDAQGDANAVWVFQMATTLTVGGPGAAFPQSIILVNGAQAKNVFWQVGSAATINAAGGGTMVGTVISSAGTSISTAGNLTTVTLEGRALSLNASVTLVNTVINVPAP